MSGRALPPDPAGRGQGGDLLLVCATPLEMAAAVRALPGGASLRLAGAALDAEPGLLPRLELPGLSLRLLVCGVGPVVSGIRLMREAGRAEGGTPRGILNFGLAGSYDLARAPVGSVVVAGEEWFPEYGVWPESGETLDRPPRPEFPGQRQPRAGGSRREEENGASGIRPGGSEDGGFELGGPDRPGDSEHGDPESSETDGPEYVNKPCPERRNNASGPAPHTGSVGFCAPAGPLLTGASHGPGMPCPLSFAQAELGGDPVFTRLSLRPHNALGNMGLNCHTAIPVAASVTVAGVSGTPDRARRMARLTGGLVENMEGFALAAAAAAMDLPFAEIRAVSNQAGRRPPHTWNIDAAAAALSRAAQALFLPFARTDPH